jgi:hypothetical protein
MIRESEQRQRSRTHDSLRAGALLLVLAAPGCGGEPGSGDGAASAVATSGAMATPPVSDAEAKVPNERSRILGPFLDSHWRLPVALQGEPRAGFSEAEASLEPWSLGLKARAASRNSF